MIRPAQPADAHAIAGLILLAMGRLAAKFANSDEHGKQVALFERFVAKTGNQYSYQNILVWDKAGEICGMIIAYDGGRLAELRTPFLQYITTQLGFNGELEDETGAGEYYIDCLAVAPAHQAQGIAKKLFKALFERAAKLGHDTVGLLVSKGNDKAKKLYIDLGFVVQGDKTLLGGVHEHLQRST
jgi:ribosomal protein S18 acetylase RimI-like enzyme